MTGAADAPCQRKMERVKTVTDSFESVVMALT
jgi:hypothetical protein